MGAGTGAFEGLPKGSVQVRNDYGSKDFGGAAPPPGDGSHRYVFTVYAVDQDKLGPDAEVSCGGGRLQSAVPCHRPGSADR